MPVFIYFAPKRAPKKQVLQSRNKLAKAPKRNAGQREKIKKQIRRARARFRGKYNDLLVYMNKIAIIATLESIGVPLKSKNKRLLEQVVTSATSDFKNLIDTGTRLTPKYKVELFDILGPDLAEKFLKEIGRFRTMVLLIETELVQEENKRDLKGN